MKLKCKWYENVMGHLVYWNKSDNFLIEYFNSGYRTPSSYHISKFLKYVCTHLLNKSECDIWL